MLSIACVLAQSRSQELAEFMPGLSKTSTITLLQSHRKLCEFSSDFATEPWGVLLPNGSVVAERPKAVYTRHVLEPFAIDRERLPVSTREKPEHSFRFLETTSRPGTSGREPFAIGRVRSTLSCGRSTGR